MAERATHGWAGRLLDLRSESTEVIRTRLHRVFRDASEAQIRAWDDSIPLLRRELSELVAAESDAAGDGAVLEYELPLELRRPDVVLLLAGPVVVLELKGKARPDHADLDQVAAYARDLRSYHRECHGREVVAVLVPTRASGYVGELDGTHVVGPDHLDLFLRQLRAKDGSGVDLDGFLAADAYQPLPTLVGAARWVFEHGDLPRVHRAHGFTQPTIEALSSICHEAAATRTRHLVLVTGVPGAGKTLVGLRLVHARFLQDLVVERQGKRLTPAVFLSGNGPLVDVLQHEISAASRRLAALDPTLEIVSGKEFVRGVKDYVKAYGKPGRTPPEHVFVFDEAQRAWDAEHVRRKHRDDSMKSEPEHFVEFAERIPEWCVVVGLVGTGQEIHVGEEAGLGQWCDAVRASAQSDEWTVHAPLHLAPTFSAIRCRPTPALNLDKEIRFHEARDVHALAGGIVEARDASMLRPLVASLAKDSFRLRITRDFETAKTHLRKRYADERDKALRDPRLVARQVSRTPRRSETGAERPLPALPGRGMVHLGRVRQAFVPPPVARGLRVRVPGARTRRHPARVGRRFPVRRQRRQLEQRRGPALPGPQERARRPAVASQRLPRPAHPRTRRNGDLRAEREGLRRHLPVSGLARHRGSRTRPPAVGDGPTP